MNSRSIRRAAAAPAGAAAAAARPAAPAPRPLGTSSGSAFAGRAADLGRPAPARRRVAALAPRAAAAAAPPPPPPPPPPKGAYAVSGATGLVGSALVRRLLAEGHPVRALTRDPARARGKLPASPLLTLVPPPGWAAAVRGAAAVVNLAGEPIATRWSPALKAEIKRSRVGTTAALAAAVAAAPPAERPPVFVSASAVGFYGASDAATFTEASPPGGDYLAEVCREWEAAAAGAASPATRVVVLRTGIVLAREGGALAKMVPVFSIFAGGPLGSGRQWCSWIHRDDLVAMILAAARDPSWSGAYNATAPNPVRMGELCAALGGAMGRPSLVPVPDFALRTLLGEGAAVVLEGQRVLPGRAQEAGFAFRFPRVAQAVRDVVAAPK